MASPFTKLIQSSREEWLSPDVQRIQLLASRELQDVLRNEARSDPFSNGEGVYTPVGFGAPIDGMDVPSSLVEVPAQLALTISFGQAYLDDVTIPDVTAGADNSPYQVLRWDSRSLFWDGTDAPAPDGTNPRIDLVIVTPAQANADIQSRNFLLDPAARTTAPANTPKTQNPQATISVVAGTADPNPTAPACPSGSLALFEVYVPANAVDASTFTFCRRAVRRAVGVEAQSHGILLNCVPIWATAGEGLAASIEFPPVGALSEYSKVVIDGEVIAFRGGKIIQPAAAPLIVQDTESGKDPFGTAAPAGNDRPYYLYLCGGRHLSQGRLNLSNEIQPVCLVESLTPPTNDGRPSLPIGTPRGLTQAGALYIGIGFTVANTTFRKGCLISGDMVYALTGQNSGTGTTSVGVGFNESIDVSGGERTLSDTDMTSHAFASRPNLSTMAVIQAFLLYTGTQNLGVGPYSIGGAAGVVQATGSLSVQVSGKPSIAQFHSPLGVAGSDIWATSVASAAAADFYVWPVAYNMRVPRL